MLFKILLFTVCVAAASSTPTLGLDLGNLFGGGEQEEPSATTTVSTSGGVDLNKSGLTIGSIKAVLRFIEKILDNDFDVKEMNGETFIVIRGTNQAIEAQTIQMVLGTQDIDETVKFLEQDDASLRKKVLTLQRIFMNATTNGIGRIIINGKPIDLNVTLREGLRSSVDGGVDATVKFSEMSDPSNDSAPEDPEDPDGSGPVANNPNLKDNIVEIHTRIRT